MNEIKFNVTSDISLSVFVYDQEADIHLYSLGSVFFKRDGFDDVLLYRERAIFLAIDGLVFKLRALLAGKLELDAVFLKMGLVIRIMNFIKKS